MFFSLLLLASCSYYQPSLSQPSFIPAVITKSANGSCPTAQKQEATRHAIEQEVRSRLLPLAQVSQCPCGASGHGLWYRIAHINMNDPDQQCPSNWRLITTPARACGRSGPGCTSAIFPSNGTPYSKVCGRIKAVQEGFTDAFHSSVFDHTYDTPGLENCYVDGVSITHGAEGSRQHIWTFASALYETDLSYDPSRSCSCTNSNSNWPYQTPSFVGTDYFCATGNPGGGFSLTTVYLDDPLWDGVGCGPASTCCQFNAPPWFCKTLPQPTTDDLELRICTDYISGSDIHVQLVDIYVN